MCLKSSPKIGKVSVLQHKSHHFFFSVVPHDGKLWLRVEVSHSVTKLKRLIYYEVNLEVGFREFQLRVAEFAEFTQAGCWILSYKSLKIKIEDLLRLVRN